MSHRVEEKILYRNPLLVFKKKVPLRKILRFEKSIPGFGGGIPHFRYTQLNHVIGRYAINRFLF